MRSTERILTTHVGSLVRPPELRALLQRLEAGDPVDRGKLEAVTVQAVRDVVAKQAEVGIDIVSDGEYGKTQSWARYVLERLENFVHEAAPPGLPISGSVYGKDRRDFADFYAEYDPKQKLPSRMAWRIKGPIGYRAHAVGRDAARLNDALGAVKGAEGFLATVAPASVAPDVLDDHYPSEEARIFAIADALAQEYRAVVDAGLMVQVDDAYLASYYDVIVPPGTLQDYRRWAELRVEALVHALRGIPPERVRYHVCWGSWNGPHTTDVPFRDIADLVLRVPAGHYALEMANPRHEHEWKVWEDTKLPEGKVLMPGVISHSTNVVEHPELVAERLTRLARLVGRENVIASTDCGFSQGPLVMRVHPSIMWAKLAAMVEGARIATRQLWGGARRARPA